VALKSNGTVVGWGDNSDSQTNAPAGLSNVVAIAGGGGAGRSPARSFAIRVNLRINSTGLSGRSTALRFRTFSGQRYSVEYSPDLSPGSWLTLPGGDLQGNWPETLVTDPNVIAGSATRFYRIKQSQ